MFHIFVHSRSYEFVTIRRLRFTNTHVSFIQVWVSLLPLWCKSNKPEELQDNCTCSWKHKPYLCVLTLSIYQVRKQLTDSTPWFTTVHFNYSCCVKFPLSAISPRLVVCHVVSHCSYNSPVPYLCTGMFKWSYLLLDSLLCAQYLFIIYCDHSDFIMILHKAKTCNSCCIRFLSIWSRSVTSDSQILLSGFLYVTGSDLLFISSGSVGGLLKQCLISCWHSSTQHVSCNCVVCISFRNIYISWQF